MHVISITALVYIAYYFFKEKQVVENHALSIGYLAKEYYLQMLPLQQHEYAE